MMRSSPERCLQSHVRHSHLDSTLYAVHGITVWRLDNILVCFRARTATWWRLRARKRQALVIDDRYSDPTTSGMCLDNCDCIFLFGAGACPCDVGGKPPSPQTMIVFEGRNPPKRDVASFVTARPFTINATPIIVRSITISQINHICLL